MIIFKDGLAILQESSDFLHAIVCATASVDELVNAQLSIYPNPSNGQFNVRANQTITSATVFDLNGKVIRSINSINQNDFSFDINENDTGIYLLQINTNTEIITKRLIKH